MSGEIEFHVPGKPEPAGSKRAFPFKRKNGKLGVAVSDDNPEARPWKGAVAYFGKVAVRKAGRRDLLAGPLEVAFVFHLVRPRGHYGKKGVLPSAPPQPITKPDVLKLARAVEDALTGIVWRDDAQIVVELLEKRYAVRYGVSVRIKEAE